MKKALGKLCKIVLVFLIGGTVMVGCQMSHNHGLGADSVFGSTNARALTSENLLNNPGFEGGTSPWYANDGGTLFRSSTYTHSGSWSCSVYPSSARNRSPRYEIRDLVPEAGYYYLEAWIMDPEIEDNEDVTAVFSMSYPFLNPAPHMGGRNFKLSAKLTEGVWHRLSGVFYIPDDTVTDSITLAIRSRARREIRPNYYEAISSGTIYVDDVVLTPVATETSRPFPQRLNFDNCIKPDMSQQEMEEDIEELYEAWKDEYLHPYTYTNGAVNDNGTAYVIKGEANGLVNGWGNDYCAASQSEATGYGMITFALMAGYDDKAKIYFDNLYELYVNFPSEDHPDLMSWAVPGVRDPSSSDELPEPILPITGNLSVQRQPSATDGDMDVAYALLLANEQWGGGPSGYDTTYYAAARRIIDALQEHNLFYDAGHLPRLGIGDNSPEQNYYRWRATRSSDFMVSHLDRFWRLTGDSDWMWTLIGVMGTTEFVQNTYAPDTGLMPDFMGDVPLRVFKGISDESGGVYDDLYFYNGCRFPWRHALSYAHTQYDDLEPQLQRINDWLVSDSQHLTNGDFDPSLIRAGYNLEGEILNHKEMGTNTTADWADDSFNAPFMSGLMVSDYQEELTALWELVKDFNPPASWGSNYYPNTLTLLNMLLVSGNWWEPSVVDNPNPQRPSGDFTYEQWEEGVTYAPGDVIQYNDQMWINTFAHTGQVDWYPGAPNLWFWELYSE